jgi:hypothetical protein
MSTVLNSIQSIASTAPIAAFAESRVAQTAQAQSQAPAPTRAETQARSMVADQVEIKALEARDAARNRAQEAKAAAAAEQPAKYASKVGLVDGTLDAFVDIVDARFQRKIARIFGPSEAPAAPAAEVAPAAVSKAYEQAAEAAAGNLRQSA